MRKDDSRNIQLCYTDTGGTFTDTFIVDENGDFVLGKAPTTPGDVGKGYFDSVKAAAQQWGVSEKMLYSQLAVAGYGSTTVINTIITRTGKRLGLIITKGLEDYLLMERGLQTFEGYTLPDKLHAVTHAHNTPLIPKRLIRGVTERVDCFGDVVIPLYEFEVRQSVEELVKEEVEGLVICFLYSYLNKKHEKRAAEIAVDVITKMGKRIPVYQSADINPVIREYSRLNSTIIEAYAGDPARRPLLEINRKAKGYGLKSELQILLSYGGLSGVDQAKMIETVESGPVGGVIGALYIGEIYGFDNIVATDVGGTTFDVGVITGKMIDINREPSCAKFRLGVPMIGVDSIGAGGGTIIRIDPLTKRVEVGPESAGADPGPVCYDRGGELPTITDVDFILGYLNPEYFLGGALNINKEKTLRIFKEKVADPLKLDVLEAAEGVKEIIDTRMRGLIRGKLMGGGYIPENYYLLAYGGAGPSHVAGYAKGLNFAGVMVFPYSAVFSAFGAAASDYEHHYHRAASIIIPPSPDDETKIINGKKLNVQWEEMENIAFEEMKQEGFSKDKVKFTRLAMIRYGGQLNDIPITAPLSRINSPNDFDLLIQEFERVYSNIFAKGARYPAAGYQILEVALISSVSKYKPKLRKYDLVSSKPAEDAVKVKREAYFGGKLYSAKIYEMEKLQAGNELAGPCVIEHPTTTLVCPPDKLVFVDEYRNLWLK